MVGSEYESRREMQALNIDLTIHVRDSCDIEADLKIAKC